jgi:hypothetical protein
VATRKFQAELEREKDGRWIADVPELPGCLTYGETRADALDKVKAIAVRALGKGGAGWTIQKQRGFLRKFLAFSEGGKIGPRMLARIKKRTGLGTEK